MGGVDERAAAGCGDVLVDLIAVLAAVTEGEPRVLTLSDGTSLPAGPLESGHRSLQAGLRGWVEQHTHHPLGYVEQLYTFADRDRAGEGMRVISISYLALTREQRRREGRSEGAWRSWYDYFPWEDYRAGRPKVVADAILPGLAAWAELGRSPPRRQERAERVAIAFGADEGAWNEELVLQRYELLYEAQLLPEAQRSSGQEGGPVIAGAAMAADHRRILATGIARLRAKIKYRPVVFELMPETFTLLQLQRTVEALAGKPVHKQNFRRLVEQQDLVEETGEMTAAAVGRPAKLFRFRPAVLVERAIAGTKPVA